MTIETKDHRIVAMYDSIRKETKITIYNGEEVIHSGRESGDLSLMDVQNYAYIHGIETK